ncbi:nitrate reductase molybdenum cofactor assembly chaperone [Mesosutterella sp. OilRF-GAM-744-9]|uniref:Nitrate reductase molybdenum cofactor assembly chaperone n=1 Tax=Mesosutterella porci TaxID=2915351 RepID=A0ABS9MQN9_9BURK|nr:nitrate reductase molybdenum cofactor assembly chaperone [Mesosutterella sp. oilRF-744-WT-GAM-9]MCG5030943.1 nitrate reductase molybdenum cofactor assembly chaperone [Mesosutterella sp. oilRF-744-WT-GAM-9]
MLKTYRILSALLDYPSEETWKAGGLVGPLLAEEGVLNAGQQGCIGQFLAWSGSFPDLRSWQQAYCSLFDSAARESLYLFDLVYGENRERGQAMVDLRETYEKSGMIAADSELPDYLPLFLEYAASQPSNADALRMMGEVGGVLRVMERRFLESGNPYLPLVTVLRELSGAQPMKTPARIIPIEPAQRRPAPFGRPDADF